MDKRIYNILFHTHTVSSIVISVALYVIFFAGSFSFFRDEIVNWERGHQVNTSDQIIVDVDTILLSLSEFYDLSGRDITLTHYYNERQIGISLTGSKDSTATKEAEAAAFFYLDTQNKTSVTYPESYTLGEFLYRLHFFAQIPYPYGYYLSGFIAFFFLFAILTGILVHWKKIISNFYVFRPWAKLKTIWTDSHTALGLIGFPFQLIYALTGAFFMIKAVVMIPFVIALYDGDEQKLNEDLEYSTPIFEYTYQPLAKIPPLSSYISNIKDQWDSFQIKEIQISNYGDQNMHLSLAGHLDYRQKMNGIGKVIYKVKDGEVVSQKNPLKRTTYLDGVKNLLFRLHLADYAGYGLRIISFLLGIISCYVILSGVMIWLVARNKKNIPDEGRRFNNKVVRWYLAICLSMFPIIAMEFSMVKLIAPVGMTLLYQTFFTTWLVLTIIFYSLKDHLSMLRWMLLLGGVFAIIIPFVNGFTTGNWIWITWQNELTQILFIDLFWLTLAIISLVTWLKISPLSD